MFTSQSCIYNLYKEKLLVIEGNQKYAEHVLINNHTNQLIPKELNYGYVFKFIIQVQFLNIICQ